MEITTGIYRVEGSLRIKVYADDHDCVGTYRVYTICECVETILSDERSETVESIKNNHSIAPVAVQRFVEVLESQGLDMELAMWVKPPIITLVERIKTEKPEPAQLIMEFL